MGFGEAVRTDGVALRTQAMYAFGKCIGQIEESYPSPYSQVLAVHQGHLEQIMGENLSKAGQTVLYDTAVVELSQDDEHVEAVVQQADMRRVFHSRYLVACDGNKCAVRDLVGLHIDPISLSGTALQQIDIRLRWSRPVTHDQILFFLFDNGFCGVCPLPDQYYRIFLCGDEQSIPNRNPTCEEMQERLRTMTHDPFVKLSNPVWFSHGRFQYGVASTFQKGRVFLAGDAAHITISIGGQGMNTGIQDAFNLGWKLASVLQGRAAPVVLDSYSLERHEIRQALATDQATNFSRLMHPTLLQKMTTRWLGRFMIEHGQSIELGRRDETQLSLAYATSPLNEDHLGKQMSAHSSAPLASWA